MECNSNFSAGEGIDALINGVFTDDLLRTVLEALPMGIAVADAKGDVVVCNTEMQRFLPTGILPFRDNDRSWRWRSFHPDGKLLQPNEFPGARALRGETVFPGVDMLYTGENNTEVWMRYAAFPINDAEGKRPDKVLIMVTEIRTLQQAAKSLQKKGQDHPGFSGTAATETAPWLTRCLEQLRTEEESLEALARVEPLLVYTYSLQEKKYAYLNTPLRNILARDEAYINALKSYLFQGILHPDDLQPYINFIGELDSLEEDEVRTLECRIWKGGSFHWYRCRHSIFFDDSDRIRQVIGICEDVSFEKRIFSKEDRGNVDHLMKRTRTNWLP